MNDKPTTEEEWIIHSINIHGVFFERWCKQAIENTQEWKVVSTNYPVAYPPNEFVKESALDIRAMQRTYDRGMLTLLIECKKNNPDFIDWVFFPKAKRAGQQAIFPAIENKPASTQQSDGWGAYPYFNKPAIHLVITDEARETRGSYQSYPDKNRDKTKTSNTAITEAARQVALATQAVSLEELTSSQRRGSLPNPKRIGWETQTFLPIIVTTAKLFTCNFDSKDVNPSTGEIPFNRATLEEQPYLIYEFPLTHHLQGLHSHDVRLTLSRQEIEQYIRMHIIVVHSNNLAAFLQFLSENLDEFFY